MVRNALGAHCPPRRLRWGRTVSLLVLMLVLPAMGCTREFFREWANQDASEAIFEKSRDPRWRLELFSVEPPPLSRYAEPYDRENPPAPPDDYAAQATSPVPQWPADRLIVPTEGTGYEDMCAAWQRQTDQKEAEAAAAAGRAPQGAGAPGAGALAPPSPGIPPTPPLGGASPFAPPPIPGPNPAGMTPNTIPGATPDAPPAPAELPRIVPPPRDPAPESVPAPGPPGASAPSSPAAGSTGVPANLLLPAAQRDPGARLANYQEVTITPPAGSNPPPTGQPRVRGSQRDMPTPGVGQDPSLNENENLRAPVNPRPDLTPEQYKASEAEGTEMAGILIPGDITFEVAEASGLPKDSKPYVVTIEQAYALGLINARVYQFNLESVYLTALAVTLQRFAFEPQFVAGMSPLTAPVGGAFSINPINSFAYSTKATGSQSSNLRLGTLAGFGKFFETGGRLLGGFANQTVFNFIGKNPRQPAVQSSIPLSFVQPFLRGGGRAVTLEPLTLAERNLLYQIRAFAKFRQEFSVALLVGGTVPTLGTNILTQGFSGGGNSDPVVGFLNVLQDMQAVENDRKNMAAFAQLAKVYAELIKGEASGLSQLQLDQVESGLVGARGSYVGDRLTYRNDLDNFRVQLGLPPDFPLVLDRRLTSEFKDVYDRIDVWGRDPKRSLEGLADIAEDLPQLQDVIIDGRSVLGIYPRGEPAREDKLEDLLLAGERVSFEHRLDLMNSRATLYDSWRNIRVQANSLQGVLNVTVTNTQVTPPTTTNPFGFLDQAKAFSLVLNTELPLIRVSERNNFSAALVNYERQRRSLQAFEDFIKLQVRQDIRNLHNQYLQYELSRRNFVLTVRQKDQSFEQIIAPPAAAAGGGINTNGAIQTSNLVSFQSRLIGLENGLVQTWLAFQLQRLQLYRDLGTLPYDEWEAFGELFPDKANNDGAAAAGIVPGSS
jgi:hypothetical protein